MQALSKRNDDPATASRPYDVTRDGFVLGEGAAALVVETEEHAKARGARIYAELVGGSGHQRRVPHHRSRPRGLGGGPRHARPRSRGADASIDDVSHINAHATSTPVGDIAEYNALRRVFGDALDGIPVSATKASTGHLLGGAGAIEAIFTVKALRRAGRPADDQPHRAGPRDPARRRHDARATSEPATCWRSATRSASAATTPSSRSARSRASAHPPSLRQRPRRCLARGASQYRSPALYSARGF